MSTPLLEANNLFCERDERVLFEQLSFTLNAGEILQVEGPNGSGKTTLLRILAGLSTAFEGELSWKGEPMSDVRDDFRASMLYFGHLPGVKATLTAEENLRWYCAVHPLTRIEGVHEALAKVGLRGYEDVPCHSLSAGQNRRVSLARLYFSEAPLWVLDEPFTAIDKRGVAEKEALIAAHAAKGGSVILTTHHELAIRDNVRQLALGGEIPR
ncbi:cytochrome c biogenesis heme-transporting ATPase CcmA [Motiliproteus sediminis]|uniref:cytochrome c biogenesis heme-transporting ATPase CcmA n=1 Tax=Motiliproteus sediminis TaxID=1468178 RepID=UPI001AEF4927|nr:cytochrome c biogenesis heme-transporting ATPase CcmA [Motiliproteus sediminis]